MDDESRVGSPRSLTTPFINGDMQSYASEALLLHYRLRGQYRGARNFLLQLETHPFELHSEPSPLHEKGYDTKSIDALCYTRHKQSDSTLCRAGPLFSPVLV